MSPTHLSESELLRDGSWKRARAAREAADWEAALDVQGKAPRTTLHYAYTVWDLLEEYPDKSIETTRSTYIHTNIYDVARHLREIEASVS